MRTLSAAGLKLIQKYEGYHKELPGGDCMAYLDTLAKPPIWTIGFGLTKGVREGMILTRATADEMFKKELSGHEKRVNELVTVPLAQPHFDALVSFDYNTGGLGRSTLLRKLNRKDYDGAEGEFKRWNKAGGKVWRGLVRRRKEEAQVFALGTLALFEDDKEDDPIQWTADASHSPHNVQEQPQLTRTKVAVGTGAAAAPAGAVAVSQAPDSTWDTVITFAGQMSSFAMSNWTTVLAIGGLCGILWFIPHLNSIRLSK